MVQSIAPSCQPDANLSVLEHLTCLKDVLGPIPRPHCTQRRGSESSLPWLVGGLSSRGILKQSCRKLVRNNLLVATASRGRLNLPAVLLFVPDSAATGATAVSRRSRNIAPHQPGVSLADSSLPVSVRHQATLGRTLRRAKQRRDQHTLFPPTVPTGSLPLADPGIFVRTWMLVQYRYPRCPPLLHPLSFACNPPAPCPLRSRTSRPVSSRALA